MSETLRNESNFRKAALAIALMGSLVVGACGGEGSNDMTLKRAEATAEAAPEADAVCDVMTSAECNTAIRTSVEEEFVEKSGFTSEEVKVGAEVDHTQNPTEAGSASFTDKDLKVLDSTEEIAAFYGSDKERAMKARANLEEKLKDRPEELARALKGEGYVPVQFDVPIDIQGTTYVVDQEILKMTEARTVKNAGDVIWVFFDKDGKIVKEASLRADCSNPEFDKITPRRPGQPEYPPIEIPMKTAKPFTFVPEYDREPGSGGSPENGMDPQNDRNTDGYGPGDREIEDRDNDGIHNSIDNCPDKAENFNDFQDTDGCPDTAPAPAPAAESTPTTGQPREEAPPSSPTTTAPPKRDETPKEPQD